MLRMGEAEAGFVASRLSERAGHGLEVAEFDLAVHIHVSVGQSGCLDGVGKFEQRI